MVKSDKNDEVQVVDVVGERALRSRVKPVRVKVENPSEGLVRCPHPDCWKENVGIVVSSQGGCNIVKCTNHKSFFYFCYRCKAEVEGGESARCSCRKRNTPEDRAHELANRNKRSKENPIEVAENARCSCRKRDMPKDRRTTHELANLNKRNKENVIELGDDGEFKEAPLNNEEPDGDSTMWCDICDWLYDKKEDDDLAPIDFKSQLERLKLERLHCWGTCKEVAFLEVFVGYMNEISSLGYNTTAAKKALGRAIIGFLSGVTKHAWVHSEDDPLGTSANLRKGIDIFLRHNAIGQSHVVFHFLDSDSDDDSEYTGDDDEESQQEHDDERLAGQVPCKGCGYYPRFFFCYDASMTTCLEDPDEQVCYNCKHSIKCHVCDKNLNGNDMFPTKVEVCRRCNHPYERVCEDCDHKYHEERVDEFLEFGDHGDCTNPLNHSSSDPSFERKVLLLWKHNCYHFHGKGKIFNSVKFAALLKTSLDVYVSTQVGGGQQHQTPKIVYR